MFIDRSPGGFTGALSTVCLLYVRMVCISPEKLLRGTSRRNRLTFAFYPSRRLCPCSRLALRSRGCSFLRIIVATSRSNMISRHVVYRRKYLFSPYICNIGPFSASVIILRAFNMFNLFTRGSHLSVAIICVEKHFTALIKACSIFVDIDKSREYITVNTLATYSGERRKREL